MQDQPKKRGAKPKTPEPGTRAALGLTVSAEMKVWIDQKARESGRSQSREVERLVELGRQLDESRLDLDRTKAECAAMLSAAKVQAIRAAGLQIVREVGGGVTVNVSEELLMAEADGILRSGFVAADDINKTPTEIMVERAVSAASERIAEQVAAKVLASLAAKS